MVLIKCSECGKEIDDNTNFCVYCGCPIEKEEKMLCDKQDDIQDLMNITFSGTLTMTKWQMTNDSIIYKNKPYKFKDLTDFRLVYSPTMPGSNGVIQCSYNSEIITLPFKFSQRDLGLKAYHYIKTRIDKENGIIKNYKYYIMAHTGTILEVYDTYLIINFMITSSPLESAIRSGSLGDKRINFTDLTSVQLREPTPTTVGFIQFAYPGSFENKGGVFAMINDENSIPILQKDYVLAKEIVNYIEERKKELKKENNTPTTHQPFSVADEIKKYKELLDCGAITQEEFDKKKQELL